MSYGYDADSNVACMAYLGSTSTPCSSLSVSTSHVITYAYDSDERMSSVEDWNGNTTSFGYDPDSNLDSITYPSGTGTSISMSYDGADALTGQTTTSTTYGTSTESWTRRADELISSYTPPGGSAESYTYDSQDRLTQGSGSTTGATYSYSAGQELNCDTEANSSGYSCPSTLNSSVSTGLFYGEGNTQGDELCADVPGTTTYSSSDCAASGQPTGETEYAYTQDGQRKKSTLIGSPNQVTTYGWDAAGDLTCLTVPNSSSATCSSPNTSYTSTMTYNANDLMVQETPAAGSSQTFTWDAVMADNARIIADGSNSYVYGPDVYGWGNLPVEQVANSSGSTEYLLSDSSGIQSVINSSGSLSESQSYSPFGRETTSGAIATPLGFKGGYEAVDGLVYFLHRFYNPAIGQFLSIDPEVAQTQQSFAFAENDPANVSDSNGMQANECLLEASPPVPDWGRTVNGVRQGLIGGVLTLYCLSFSDLVPGVICAGLWAGSRLLTDHCISSLTPSTAFDHGAHGAFWEIFVDCPITSANEAYTLWIVGGFDALNPALWVPPTVIVEYKEFFPDWPAKVLLAPRTSCMTVWIPLPSSGSRQADGGLVKGLELRDCGRSAAGQYGRPSRHPCRSGEVPSLAELWDGRVRRPPRVP